MSKAVHIRAIAYRWFWKGGRRWSTCAWSVTCNMTRRSLLPLPVNSTKRAWRPFLELRRMDSDKTVPEIRAPNAHTTTMKAQPNGKYMYICAGWNEACCRLLEINGDEFENDHDLIMHVAQASDRAVRVYETRFDDVEDRSRQAQEGTTLIGI